MGHFCWSQFVNDLTLFLTEESPGPRWLPGWFGWWGLWRWDPEETRQEQVKGKRRFATAESRNHRWYFSVNPSDPPPPHLSIFFDIFCATVANFCRDAATKMGRRSRRRRQQLRRRGISLTPVTVSERFHGFMHVGKESFSFWPVKDKNNPSAMHGAVWKTPPGAETSQSRNSTIARLNALFFSPSSSSFIFFFLRCRSVCALLLPAGRCSLCKCSSQLCEFATSAADKH